MELVPLLGPAAHLHLLLSLEVLQVALDSLLVGQNLHGPVEHGDRIVALLLLSQAPRVQAPEQRLLLVLLHELKTKISIISSYYVYSRYNNNIWNYMIQIYLNCNQQNKTITAYNVYFFVIVVIY